MHFNTLAGVSALITLVSAVPVEKRSSDLLSDLGFGDRTPYVSAYQAGHPAAGPTDAPVPQNQPQGDSAAAPGYVHEPQSSYETGKDPYKQPVTPPNSAGGAAPKKSSDKPFALDNGFPDIANPSDALTAINLAAHGTLSNAPPPAKAPSAETLKSLQLVCFNEIFEVYYFTQLLKNVTESVKGYGFQDEVLKKKVITTLTAVQAQEELHALNACGAVKRFGGEPIKACQYRAPVETFHDAIFLASTFTDVVLGTLADASVVAGQNGDAGNIRGFAASLGQEGEQNGFYRDLLGKIPSALPFLTASVRNFAFSALNQNFVVEGSCPNVDTIDLKIFSKLTLETPNPILPKDQDLNFSFQPKDGVPGKLSLVYINQQNVPIVQPVQLSTTGGPIKFTAPLPYTKNLMNGLTFAVLVEGEGPFPNITSVDAATKYGPALIEIN